MILDSLYNRYKIDFLKKKLYYSLNVGSKSVNTLRIELPVWLHTEAIYSDSILAREDRDR